MTVTAAPPAEAPVRPPTDALEGPDEPAAPRAGNASWGQRIFDDPDLRYGAKVSLAALGLLVFVNVLFPAPAAIVFVGAVLGSLSALIALGVVLVYRANRIINFSQGDLGALAGVLAVSLIVGPGWPFFAAIAVGLVAALALGAVVEFAFIRRFAKAPRLILTVATIGIAQLLQFGQLVLPSAFGYDTPPQNFPTPFDFTFRWDPVIFRGNHLFAIMVVPVVMVAVAAFLRFTRVGIAVRASAESSERAEQLGIPVRRIQLTVWVVAAGLSGLAALLRAPLVGVSIGTVLGPALLLRALAAAVIGKMENLPVTFAAAVLLGMAEQAIFWHTGQSAVTDGVLFLVVIGALLFTRHGKESRADDTGTSSWDAVKEVRPVPHELLHLPEVRFGLRLLPGVVVLALVLAPFVLSTSRVNLVGTGVILAIVGVSLVILTGWSGQISLGHMALFGLGAATAGTLSQHGWDLLACLLAAGVVGAGASMVIGIPALRIRGPFLAVATFAFALATSSYFLSTDHFPWLVPEGRVLRPRLYGKFDLEPETSFYLLLLVVLGLTFASARSIRRSRTFRVLVATRDNPRAAQSLGISLLRARLAAFAISGFFAAVAGGLFVFHQHALGSGAFRPESSIRVFSMVVFGGLGSLPGALLGAAYFTAVDFFIPLPGIRFLVSGVGLLLVLLLVPGGLGQLLYQLRDGLLRRIAMRRHILVPSLLADRRSESIQAADDEDPADPVPPDPPAEVIDDAAHRGDQVAQVAP